MIIKGIIEEMNTTLGLLANAVVAQSNDIKTLEARVKELEDKEDMHHMGYKESEEESGDSLGR